MATVAKARNVTEYLVTVNNKVVRYFWATHSHWYTNENGRPIALSKDEIKEVKDAIRAYRSRDQ